jgi:hypothetical protein
MDIEKAIESIIEQQANLTLRQLEAEERNDRAHVQHGIEMAEIRSELRRVVRLSIQESRNDRKLRQEVGQEFDKKITQLAAAHLVNEELLKAFLKRGGNGSS